MIIDAVKQLSDLMKQPIYIKSPRNCFGDHMPTARDSAVLSFVSKP